MNFSHHGRLFSSRSICVASRSHRRVAATSLCRHTAVAAQSIQSCWSKHLTSTDMRPSACCTVTKGNADGRHQNSGYGRHRRGQEGTDGSGGPASMECRHGHAPSHAAPGGCWRPWEAANREAGLMCRPTTAPSRPSPRCPAI